MFNIVELCIIFTIYSLFAIFCAIFHIIKKEYLRKIIKCCPLLILIISLIIKNPTNWMPYTAFIFGCLGDALLIPRTKKLFLLGTISFLIQHIILFVYLVLGNAFLFASPIFYIVIVLFEAVHIIVFIRFMKIRAQKVLTILGAIYTAVLVLNLVTPIFISISTSSLLPLLMTLGYISYSFSDSLIILRNVHIDFPKHRDLWVIITYYLAQIILFIYIIIPLL